MSLREDFFNKWYAAPLICLSAITVWLLIIIGIPLALIRDACSTESARSRRKERYRQKYGPEGGDVLSYLRDCGCITIGAPLLVAALVGAGIGLYYAIAWLVANGSG
jgi:hypothetical protein